ncbi:ribosomal protein S18-alanine N-acetyltransferase [Bifidobacterium biavatii]|uniref:Ribosomal-protein-alanine acetyl transferase n=1 Tax=Bifidobacterium biavatii DSM 23969 TaxID=1437608 RepID=A0A086ZQ96_9BIFI|nr:ribosomal protein S18-alanine N-acetyltransferase [Bifidobacterium biavatii]KFI48696.1 ribosomal- protein-alanine acetyl transferase [Bifidobacterium biavatii DSM 23969]
MLASLDELDRETAVAAVRALEVELFGRHAWSEASIRQELDAPARTYVFDVADAANDADATGGDADAAGNAVANDRVDETIRPDDVRGFAGYWYDGDDAEIMDVGVGKAYQRQGIAAAMMTWLIGHARSQGARRVLLEVRVDNDPAIALYRRFGFENIGLRKRYYQPEGIDAHVMALDLEPRIVGFQSAGADAGYEGNAAGAARQASVVASAHVAAPNINEHAINEETK